MPLGYTILVVEPIMELVDTAFVRQRQPGRGLSTLRECMGGEEDNRASSRYAGRKFLPIICRARIVGNIAYQDHATLFRMCAFQRCNGDSLGDQPRLDTGRQIP